MALSNYRVSEELGGGSFGVVRLATDLTTKEKVAIKSISKGSIADIAEVERVSREFFILTCLDHKNVIRLLEVAQDERYLHLVMEYAGGGSLDDMLKAQPDGRLSEHAAREVFDQLASGVKYCHQKRVVHRDLKPENILLSKSGDIKVADFGLSNTVSYGAVVSSPVGTPLFTAPEILVPHMYHTLDYNGQAADVWSMGVILYGMVVGDMPFPAKTLRALREQITTRPVDFPSCVSDAFRSLIQSMLNTDPEQRPSADEVFHNPWVRGAEGSLPHMLREVFATPRDRLPFTAREGQPRGLAPPTPSESKLECCTPRLAEDVELPPVRLQTPPRGLVSPSGSTSAAAATSPKPAVAGDVFGRRQGSRRRRDPLNRVRGLGSPTGSQSPTSPRLPSPAGTPTSVHSIAEAPARLVPLHLREDDTGTVSDSGLLECKREEAGDGGRDAGLESSLVGGDIVRPKTRGQKLRRGRTQRSRRSSLPELQMRSEKDVTMPAVSPVQPSGTPSRRSSVAGVAPRRAYEELESPGSDASGRSRRTSRLGPSRLRQVVKDAAASPVSTTPSPNWSDRLHKQGLRNARPPPPLTSSPVRTMAVPPLILSPTNRNASNLVSPSAASRGKRTPVHAPSPRSTLPVL